jgi:hypothetical protein
VSVVPEVLSTEALLLDVRSMHAALRVAYFLPLAGIERRDLRRVQFHLLPRRERSYDVTPFTFSADPRH